MALDSLNVLVGPPVFSIGDWVTAGGAGTLTDVGHSEAIELGGAFENFDVDSERATEIVATYPQKSDWTVKVPMLQAEVELLRIAAGQPSGNKTGSGENLTLRVGSRAAQYHQATLVVPGPGTTGVRTITFWRLQATAMDPIVFSKAAVQKISATFRALRDDSVTTADKIFKLVDA